MSPSFVEGRTMNGPALLSYSFVSRYATRTKGEFQLVSENRSNCADGRSRSSSHRCNRDLNSSSSSSSSSSNANVYRNSSGSSSSGGGGGSCSSETILVIVFEVVVIVIVVKLLYQ